MTTGVGIVRIVIGAIGSLLLLGGVLLALSGGGAEAVLGALWMIVSGGVLVIVAVIEVGRYRSEAAERGGQRPGPGGGETSPLETRFQRTDEVFTDPTSRQKLRVYTDPATGERRYVAE
jgi:hypothetical protein